MTQRADRLFDEAQDLAPEERAILALKLLDSVGEPEPAIAEEWRAEVRDRLTQVQAGRAKISSWDEARRRIFARE